MLMLHKMRRLRRPPAPANVGGGGSSPADSPSSGGSDSPSYDVDADWLYRKNSPGVIRWIDFNDDTGSRMSGVDGDAVGVELSDDTLNAPVLQSTLKVSGAKAIQFTVRTSHTSNDAGAYFANFSDYQEGQYGDNSDFYVQVRARWNAVLCGTLLNEGGQKIFGITGADRPGHTVFTSSDLKIVVHTYGSTDSVFAYRYFPNGTTSNLVPTTTVENGSYLIQNGPATHCNYDEFFPIEVANQNGGTSRTAQPGCFSMEPDIWFTFMLGVTLGATEVSDFGPGVGTHPVWANSRVRVWGAKDGEAPTLITDWKPGVGAYYPLAREEPTSGTWSAQCYGKVWLLPYLTDPQVVTSHSPGIATYDELIISTQPIPFPNGHYVDATNSTLQAGL